MGMLSEKPAYVSLLSPGRTPEGRRRNAELLSGYDYQKYPTALTGYTGQDLERPIQLSLSADIYLGWPVTLARPDGSLITSHASTSHLKHPPDIITCEVVRWQLPE